VSNKDGNSRDPLEEEATKLLKRKIQGTVFFFTEAKNWFLFGIFPMTFEIPSDSPRGSGLPESFTHVRCSRNNVSPTNRSSSLPN
jgi:hypothetical protein